MITQKSNLETLNKKFKSLNRKYVKLEKTLNNEMSNFDSLDISEKLEEIQTEMTKVANELENI